MSRSSPALTELSDSLRNRRLSAEALLRSTLAEIERSDAEDPSLNAFLSLADESLLEEAVALDRALDAGNDVGPLAGIPVAIKDNICTLELPTTCGSHLLSNYLSPYEATVARRLRAAGALIVGKTNLDEFAMGSSTENSAFGPTLNPLDRGRVPGGSSGGSAAAVAAGLVPAALGSDTGGSIRQPAAFCGVVGLKPTYGRVSRYGLVAFASSLDVIGPLAGNVTDAATMLQVIAGSDPFDSTAADVPVPDLVGELGGGVDGLVVGLPAEFLPADLDGRIAAVCHAAAERLARLGAEVRSVSVPSARHAISAYYLVANAEASSNLARHDGVRYGRRAPQAKTAESVYRRTRGEGFGREVKRRIVLGTYGLSAGYYDAYYGRGQRARRQLIEEFAYAFDAGVDVLLTPTAPTVAFALGERLADPLSMYLSDVFTVPANLAGVPAVSIRGGMVDALPVGVQLMGRPFAEGKILRAARALEADLDSRGPVRPAPTDE